MLQYNRCNTDSNELSLIDIDDRIAKRRISVWNVADFLKSFISLLKTSQRNFCKQTLSVRRISRFRAIKLAWVSSKNQRRTEIVKHRNVDTWFRTSVIDIWFSDFSLTSYTDKSKVSPVYEYCAKTWQCWNKINRVWLKLKAKNVLAAELRPIALRGEWEEPIRWPLIIELAAWSSRGSYCCNPLNKAPATK